MFPILFEIPNVAAMAGEIVVVECVVGVVCLLCWIALRMRGSQGWATPVFSTAAIVIGLHLLLSWFMGKDQPITIYSFGVVIILAFLAGAYFMTRQTERLHVPTQKVFDWGFWLLVTGIVGSRLLFAFLNYEDFQDNKLEIFRIWNGGLVWYGGLIPAAILGVWLLQRYRLPVLHVADVGSVALMLGLGIGRWACLMAGDDYGRPTDAWLGIRFYEPALVDERLYGVALHPTQLYMSLNALWLFFILEWIRRRARFAGQAFAWMLILYAVTRLLVIEPFRGDFVERNPGWRKHLALSVGIEKEEGSAPLRLERGAKVTGADGRTGKLLEDLDLGAGRGRGSVWALSNRPAQPRKASLPLFEGAGAIGYPPDWEIETIEGLPPQTRIVPGETSGPRWYGSDLAPPPGYVSTSQLISLFVVLAGVGVLLVTRRLNVDGYTEAARSAVPPAESA
ncbi:MAG: prolipoprotein diacylglyceryl transferase [Planctomycetota bacterium]|jgi:phosphatidylglycerol:prolipoprotein diacylglycerol transferase